jgi:hypothetical protein
MNIVQSPRLQKVFFILRNELKKFDIPARSTIRNHIMKKLSEYLEKLGEDMKVKIVFFGLFVLLNNWQKPLGKISFTTDVWSDPNLASFMGVTAHWTEGVEVRTMTGPQKKLELRSDLVGFLNIPGRHTGKHLAECFMFILDRMNITEKVSFAFIYLLGL